MAKKKKTDANKTDGGISPAEIARIRSALRQVWQWTSLARRLCIKRATDKKGFGHCEEPTCKKKVPKVYADHIEVLGTPLAPDYLIRLYCSSKKLQALCSRCHNKKTKEERDLAKFDEWLDVGGEIPFHEYKKKRN